MSEEAAAPAAATAAAVSAAAPAPAEGEATATAATTTTTTTTEETAAAAAAATESSDVLPERVPKPDKEAMNERVTELNELVEQKQAQLNAIFEQLKAENEKAKSAYAGSASVREEIRALHEQRKEAVARRRAIMEQRNMIREALGRMMEEGRNLRGELRFDSEAKFDEEIRRLEVRQETESLSLTEEKALIKDIETLKAGRRRVSQLEESKQAVDTSKAERSDLDAQVTAASRELDQISAAIDEKKAQLDAMPAAQRSREQTPEVLSLLEQRDGMKASISATRDEIRAVRDAFYKANDKYFNYIRAVRKQREEQKAREREERRKQDAERRRKQEEEEAKRDPWEKQKFLCDELVSYLTTTFADVLGGTAAAGTGADAGTGASAQGDGTVDSTTVAGSVASGAVEVDGRVLTAYVRNNDAGMPMNSVTTGGKRGKKNRKNKNRQRDPMQETIVHNLDALSAFSELQLEAPANRSLVAASVDAVRAKKEWYNAQPRPQKKKKQTTENGAADETADANAAEGDSANTGVESAAMAAAEEEKSESSDRRQQQSAQQQADGGSGKQRRKGGRKGNAVDTGDEGSFPSLPGSRPKSEVTLSAAPGFSAADVVAGNARPSKQPTPAETPVTNGLDEDNGIGSDAVVVDLEDGEILESTA